VWLHINNFTEQDMSKLSQEWIMRKQVCFLSNRIHIPKQGTKVASPQEHIACVHESVTKLRFYTLPFFGSSKVPFSLFEKKKLITLARSIYPIKRVHLAN